MSAPVPVLAAVTGASWEAALVSALERAPAGITVVRRCVDLPDLLAAASVGTARAVLLSAGLRRLDREALSRALFSSMVPPHKSGEFFGFFSVFEKFAGIFGPLLFGITIAFTGSSRGAILSVIAFFAIGAALLSRVDVRAGVSEGRAREAGVRVP